MESIEKATERASMLAKQLMETPLPQPPMVKPPLLEPPRVEPDRILAKRRRRTRFTPLPGIMEHAVYLAPNAWPPIRHALEKLCYIGEDYDAELLLSVWEKTCDLPDGNVILVVVHSGF